MGPIVVLQHNTMWRIAHPIHDPQSGPCEKPIQSVVLNKDGLCGDTLGFREEKPGIYCVMQHIDKHDDIETPVRERYRRPIEACYRDLRVLANQDIDTANRRVTPSLQD